MFSSISLVIEFHVHALLGFLGVSALCLLNNFQGFSKLLILTSHS